MTNFTQLKSISQREANYDTSSSLLLDTLKWDKTRSEKKWSTERMFIIGLIQ